MSLDGKMYRTRELKKNNHLQFFFLLVRLFSVKGPMSPAFMNDYKQRQKENTIGFC